MKPIGKNTDPDASPVSQRGEQDVFSTSSPQLNSRIRSVPTARIEDILAELSGATVTDAAVPRPQHVVSDDFADHLHSAVSHCVTLEDAQAATAAVLQQHAAVPFVGWYVAGGSRIGQSPAISGLTGDISEVSQHQQAALKTASAAAVQDSMTRCECVPDSQAMAIAVPVRSLPGQCLLIVTRSGDAIAAGQRRATEMAAVRLSEWQTQQQSELVVRESRHVAALVELVGRIASCPSLKSAGQCLVDELQKYLGATDVSFGVCDDHQPRCRLTAVSASPDVDRFSEPTRLTEAVLQESIARSAASIWPNTDALNRHALLSHQQFAEQRRVPAVVSTPLRDADGKPAGAIVATFESEEAAADGLSFLFASERALATAVASLTRSNLSYYQRMTSALRRVCTAAKLKTVLLVCVLATVAMLIPMDYRVTCESELQPVARRFVAAPFDAPLKECLVEPGDVVEAGQLLAVLDGRELRWELAGVRADFGKATKEHNTHLSEQKFGEAAIARHEIDRLQNKSALLEDRTKNLEIRSPIAGVIVAGDLKDTEGVPLETGQSLFEVAPLDRMIVEVAIPEEDVRHVRNGMTLRLRLDAMPTESIDATIQRIHPKAELRDHENVFIAEAELPNDAKHFRPGMRGTTRVSTGSRPVGWNLFHKPFAYFVGWLGW